MSLQLVESANQQSPDAGLFTERVQEKLARSSHPYVTLKAAITLDGKIATRSGASQWITGEAGREFAHQLRANHDGILAGINTVRADDPQLTVRLPGNEARPARVVLDSNCGISPTAKCLADDGARRFVITGSEAPAAPISRLREMGVVVHACADARPTAEEFLPFLRAEGLNTLLVEGGGLVHANMIAHGAADELFLIIAGKIAGDDAPGWCASLGLDRLEDTPRLKLQSMQRAGEDLVVHGLFMGEHHERNERIRTTPNRLIDP